MIISIHAEKASDEMQHPFMIKKKKHTPGSGHKGNLPQRNKGYI